MLIKMCMGTENMTIVKSNIDYTTPNELAYEMNTSLNQSSWSEKHQPDDKEIAFKTFQKK